MPKNERTQLISLPDFINSTYMTVSLVNRGLKELPEDFLLEKPTLKRTVEVLDLSHNQITNIAKLDGYDNIHTLILDSNKFNSHSSLPKMHSLTYLSLVDNKIGNLAIFIDKIADKVPNLKYLNLLKNPAAPNYFNGGSADDYKDYRLYVINSMPNIKVVDYIEVGEEEIKEAKRVYGHLPPAVVSKPISKDLLKNEKYECKS
ncbi:Leucine-rich repeat-containing protein [Oopsacas minuta]|uniref:Leucine-rich repeat-containing protein n=1 Tax=Oopsacas minuta TaxID=111878 RepID=A0AAV7KHI7_9METZ|nr:Leucine-rich repeat-containing protein [Oopsacas minuta]